MITSSFALSILKMGVILLLLAVPVEWLLVRFGLVRGNTIGLIIAAFFLSFVKQLMDSDGSLLLYSLFMMFVGPIAVNRSDLVVTMTKGKWWWKSEN